MKIKDIMTTNVITVHKDDSVKKVAQILSENRISGAPVVDNEGRMLGVVSEGDLIYGEKRLYYPPIIQVLDGIIFTQSLGKFEADLKKITALKADDLMSTEVIWVDQETDINHAATLMIERSVNRLPVMGAGKLVGIVTRADIVRYIAQREGTPDGESHKDKE